MQINNSINNKKMEKLNKKLKSMFDEKLDFDKMNKIKGGVDLEVRKNEDTKLDFDILILGGSRPRSVS